MVDPVTIGLGLNKWLKDADTKLITISNPAMQEYSYVTLHDESDTDYMVPVGKQFIILQISFNERGADNDNYFKFHTVVDTDGGTRFIYAKSDVDMGWWHYNTYLTIPASNYVNQKGNYQTAMTGIETTT